MKKSLYLKFSLLAVFLICIIAACTKMDYTYKKFLKDGDIIYPGKADSVQIFSGHNRIKLSWLLTSDPSIVRCSVYWNNKVDSIDVPVNRSPGVDTISVIIDSLKEGYYNFQIYTYDKDGNISIATDTIGQVYGDIYASSLHERVIKKAYWNADSAFIFWYNPNKGAVVTEINYTDKNGYERQVKIIPDDTVSILPGFKLHDTFQYRTGYLPDSLSIDTFYTAFGQTTVDSLLYVPPENLALSMKIIDKSSGCGCGPATNLTDGDESSFWQPNGSDRRDDKMVYATIDLGSTQTFNELKQFWTHGHQHIDYYTIYYSDDNSTWKTAYVSDIGPDEGENSVTFLPVTGQYIKLELHFVDDGNVNIGEIEVYNDPAVTPPQNMALDQSIADKSSDCSCGRATDLTDGDQSTYWQPLGSDRSDKEISVTIDLGTSQEFNKVDQYWEKGESQVESYQILYSDDASTWNTAYENTSGISSEEKVAFHTVKGRYVKLVFKLNDTSSEQVSEIEIYNQ